MKFKKAVLIKNAGSPFEVAENQFDPKYWDQLNDLIESKVSMTANDLKLKDALKDCDCLLLGFQVPITKDILDAAPNLKLINIFATAHGTVDLEESAKRKIPVCNLGDYSSGSTRNQRYGGRIKTGESR